MYLAGVKMNDAITGYSPFSLWSGLNEAMRSKETVNGAEVSDFGFGGYNGLTNIFGNATNVRKGLRGSVLTNSSLYRLRVMGSYATGLMDNGWAFAANVSARLGGNDWIDGVYYRSFAYYLAADKVFNDANKLSLVFFATPGQRGAQNASTQEVYDLMGTTCTTPTGATRTARCATPACARPTSPWPWPSGASLPRTSSKAASPPSTAFGKNGYTALDWYDAQDPRPDYYRNLPSYFYGTIRSGHEPQQPDKYAWAKEVWSHANMYPELTHINWDRLYQVNCNRSEDRPFQVCPGGASCGPAGPEPGRNLQGPSRRPGHRHRRRERPHQPHRVL